MHSHRKTSMPSFHGRVFVDQFVSMKLTLVMSKSSSIRKEQMRRVADESSRLSIFPYSEKLSEQFEESTLNFDDEDFPISSILLLGKEDYFSKLYYIL